MPKYTIRFTGRRVGAIGIFYPIVAQREANNEEAAVLALYDEYEHIHNPVVTLVKE